MFFSLVDNAMIENNTPGFFQAGQVVVIPGGAAFENILRRIIREEIDAVLSQHLPKTDTTELIEQHTAAKMLGKHTATLYRWAKAGAIESVKQGPGRKVFYRRGDIEKIKAGEWPNIR